MSEICLRLVENIDRERLWFWSNDPEVRSNSFDSRPISWEEHCRWFSGHLADPLWRAWIGMDSMSHPIGVVRFQMQGVRAEIAVNVAATLRGQGFGRSLIHQGCTQLFDTMSITAVDAFIKPNNTASLAAFRTVGFKELVPLSQSSFLYRHLVFERSWVGASMP